MTISTLVKVHLGHRGSFLLFISVSWVLIGLSYVTNPSLSKPIRTSLKIPLTLLPLHVWGIIWLVCGVVGIVSAFLRGPGNDRFGFIALEAIGMIWSASYLVGWLFGYYDRGWVNAAIFGAVCGAIMVCSGWAEPKTGFKPMGDA